MRNLTLDEKITIRGILSPLAITSPDIGMKHLVQTWNHCYAYDIKNYYKMRAVYFSKRRRFRDLSNPKYLEWLRRSA